jgi:hypothetical protein
MRPGAAAPLRFGLLLRELRDGFRVLITAAVLMPLIVAFQAGATVVLGSVARDLTGDGLPEILRVVGVGPTIDDLAVTFTIESAGRTVFRAELAPMTRAAGFDAGRRIVSAEEHRGRIEEFGRWFFAEKKFQQPTEFLESLRGSTPLRVAEISEVIARDRAASDERDGRVIAREILESPATIFTFSPGGDEVIAIGWSAQANRFYRLMECCWRIRASAVSCSRLRRRRGAPVAPTIRSRKAEELSAISTLLAARTWFQIPQFLASKCGG